jgi:hypothetical protein
MNGLREALQIELAEMNDKCLRLASYIFEYDDFKDLCIDHQLIMLKQYKIMLNYYGVLMEHIEILSGSNQSSR